MKQHPDSVNRDLDDEVAEAIEHRYAQKLARPAPERVVGQAAGAPDHPRRSAVRITDGDPFDAEMDNLREKSGF